MWYEVQGRQNIDQLAQEKIIFVYHFAQAIVAQKTYRKLTNIMTIFSMHTILSLNRGLKLNNPEIKLTVWRV